MVNKPIDLENLEETPQVNVDLDVGSTRVTLDSKALDDKANKIHFSLGENSPGKDQIKFDLSSGSEDSLRRRSAEQKTWQNQQLRNNLIKETLNAAARQGRSVTEEEAKRIQTLSNADINLLREDPDSFFEREQAKAIIRNSVAETSAYKDAENKEEVNKVLSLGEQLAAIREMVYGKLKESESRWKQTSTLGAIGDIAFLMSGLSYFNTRNNVEGSEGGFLTGSNLESQRVKLFSMSPEEAKKALDEVESKMVSLSELDKMKVYKFFLDPSFSDRFIENVVGVLDVAGVGSLAGAGIARTASAARVAKTSSSSLIEATKQAIRESGREGLTLSNLRAAVGDLSESAFLKVRDELKNIREGIKGADEVHKAAMSIHNPGSILEEGSAVLRGNAYHKMKTMLNNNAANIQRIFEGSLTQRITRLTELQSAEAFDEVQKLVRTQYQLPEDAILDTVNITSDVNQLSNNDVLAVLIGRQEGGLFDSPEQARISAKYFYGDMRDYEVVPVGAKFALRVNKPVNETSVFTREALRDAMKIDVTQGSSPLSVASSVVKAIGGADIKLATSMLNDFKKGVVGASAMQELVRTIAKPIGKLRGKSKQRLLKFMDIQRKFQDKQGNIGRFSQDQLSFEKEWFKEFSKLPSEKESQAYWSAVQMNDLDWSINNMALYTQRKRSGQEMFGFHTSDPENIVIRSDPEFRGVFRESIDWTKASDSDTESILVWSRNPEELKRIPLWAPNARTKHDELVEQGYKVIQMSDDGISGLKTKFTNLPKGSHRYIMVKQSDLTQGPLSLKQLPYRPGGHIMYPRGWFMSQAIVRGNDGTNRQFYNGDINIHNFGSRGNAREITDRYNKSRELLIEARNTGDFSKFNQYVKTNMPITPNEFRKMFKGKNSLDINQPFLMRPAGTSLYDFHKLEDIAAQKGVILRSSARSSHNPDSDIGVRFGESRDQILSTVDLPSGDSRAPILGVRDADLIDPVSAIDRSASNLARSLYFDDLKIKAGEEFISKYGPILKDDHQTITSSPIRTLLDGEFKSDAPVELVTEAKRFRAYLKQIMNTEDDFDSAFNVFKQRMAEAIYEKAGLKAFNYVKPFLLHRESRPSVVLRTIGFDLNLGLFSPMQLLIQSQSWVHVAALEGLPNAIKAGSAAVQQAAISFAESSNLTRHLAKDAKSFGWVEKEFIEATESMRKAGWDTIGGSVSQIADYVNPRIVQSRLGEVRSAGRMFFNAGERYLRRTAWNASYLKWRRANPDAPLNQKAMDEIIQRADTLSINMTAASNASWQAGLAAIPTQFMAFQFRLMEQFWGKQLTKTDRLRIAATYSAYYGVPIGATGTALGGVWPMHEEFRDYMLKNNGIDWDEDTFNKIFMEGVPSFLLSYVTGEDYNVASRLGPGGNPVLRDLFVKDKSLMEALAGASGTTLQRVYELVDPLTSNIMRSVAGTDEFRTADHILNFFRLSSSGRSAVDMVDALGIIRHLHINKKEDILGKLSANEEFAKFLTGVSPQKVDDFWRMVQNTRSREQYIKEVSNKAGEFYRRAIRTAWNGGNKEEVQSLLATAQLIMDGAELNPQQRKNAFDRAVEGEGIQTQYERARDRFYDLFEKARKADIERTKKGTGE